MSLKSTLQEYFALLDAVPEQVGDRLPVSETDFYGPAPHAALVGPTVVDMFLVFPDGAWARFGTALNKVRAKFGDGGQLPVAYTLPRSGPGGEEIILAGLTVAGQMALLQVAIPQLSSNVALYALLGAAGVAAAGGLVWSATRRSR